MALLMMAFALLAPCRDCLADPGPAAPRDGARRIVLRELWRSGDDDSGPIFGLLAKVLQTPDGSVAALDFQQSVIFLFSPNGEPLSELALAGEGPGEANNPVDLVPLADNTFGLVQSFPGKIEILDEHMQAKRSVPSRSFLVGEGTVTHLFDAMDLGGDILCVGESIGEDSSASHFKRHRVNFVSVLGPDDRLRKPIYCVERTTDWTAFRFDEDSVHRVDFNMVAVGPKGRIFVPTTRNGYEITAFDENGNVDLVIERSFAPVARTQEEKTFLAADYLAQASGSIRPEIKVSDFVPDVESIEISPAGELRVVTSRSYSCHDPSVFCRYDVFDVEGHFVRYDDVVLTGEDRSGRLFWLSRDRVALVTGLHDVILSFQRSMHKVAENPGDFYDQPMELVVYAVDQGGGD